MFFGEPTLDLVLIGGNFKSGTSLLCEHVENSGYRNPAHITSAAELGHGIGAGMYSTRECATARHLNRALAKANLKECGKLEGAMSAYLGSMISALGPQLVIKDPYMKIFADHWLRAAKRVGIERGSLLLTRRADIDVFRSWSNSRFLSRVHRSDPFIFGALSAPIAAYQVRKLANLGAHVQVVDFHQLPGLICGTERS